MARIKINNLDLPLQETGEPFVRRYRIHTHSDPDVTLINLNLMLINQNGKYDQQNYLPLGILYLASYLGKYGYNIEIIDYQLFSHARTFDMELLVRTMGETAPLVGISTMTNLLPMAIQCAEEIKKRQPGCQVILGGTGPSPVSREIVQAFPFIDSVVTGEGERVMLDFLRQGITAYPPRMIVENLDEIPLPAYSLIDFELYDASPSIITSRGCPYACTFCTEPHNFGGQVRFRSIGSILQEIEWINSLSGRTLFLFQDDILPLHRDRFRELLMAFRGLSFPLLWKCFSRVDLMDEELMKEMAQRGCVQVRYGIESGSNQTLKQIKKGFTIEQAYDSVKKSLQYFPSVHVSFIWGYPFETEKEFEETLKWVSKFERMKATVLLFEFSPLPGSQIYQKFHADLKFYPENYSFFVITGHEVIQKGAFEVRPRFSPIYKLIKTHPHIFPGFYTYENMDHLRKKKRLDRYQTTHRTSIKGEYDL